MVQAGRRSAIIPLTSDRNRVLPDGLLDGVAFRASTLACREWVVETISFSFPDPKPPTCSRASRTLVTSSPASASFNWFFSAELFPCFNLSTKNNDT